MKMQQPMPPMPMMQLPPELQKIVDDPVRLAELMQNPTWEEVEALLRDDAMLGFRIDIETDSTIKQDEDAEKASRVELLTAVSQFISNASVIQDPAARVFMAELLGFGVRGFNAGKQIEGAVEVFIKKVEDEAKNPKPAPPDPEMVKAQAQIQQKNAEMQMKQKEAEQSAALEAQKLQGQVQMEQYKQQMESQRATEKHQADIALTREKAMQDQQLKREIAMIDAETRRMAAQANAANKKEGASDATS